MSSCHRLILSAGGRLVIVKEAAPGAAADRLRREAEMLRQASHPGVVELVDIDELEGGAVALTTAFVAGGTLRDSAGRLEPVAVAGVVAGLATTLADLHDRGIVHGRLSTDHVLLGSTSGAPVLCGLAEARTVDGHAAAELDATDDTEALATLVGTLTSPGSGPLTDALRQAVERWHAGAGATRPTLRSLAVTLAGLVPGEAPVAGPGTTTGRSLPPRRSPARHQRPGLRSVSLAAAAVAVGIVAVVAVATAGGGRPPPATVDAPVPAAVPYGSTSTSSPATMSTVPPPPTTEAPVRVFPRAECPPADPPAADVDGDGCPNPLEVSHGVVAAAGARWQVGAPDDLVVIGDWDCDGLATPAVVRPSSGHVWTFPRWADHRDGDGVVAEPVDVVPVPVAKATVVEDAGSSGTGQCDGIEVIASGGDRRLVHAAT